MIEESNSQDPDPIQSAAEQPVAETIQSAAAESLEVPAELGALSQAGRELLAVSQEALKDFHPEAGALDDLPQLTIDAKDTARVCSIAKEDSRLDMRQLLCLACVDYEDHLQLVYFLHSLNTDHTLVVKTSVPSDNPRLPSITGIWRAGEWYEREAHDLFGVEFEGHPGLTPLLLYEGFEGYPGRKDFPFNDYQEY